MNSFKKSIISMALLMGLAPNISNARTGEERIVSALTDALLETVFPQCRVEIYGSYIYMERGIYQARMNLMSREARRTTDGKSLKVVGPAYQYCEDGVFTDSYEFVLNADGRRITEVIYSRSLVKEVNRGTILAPRLEKIEIPDRAFRCETN